ncbi:MAG: hypothetical protein AAF170_07650 [Bacteroidota bacterium]
MRPGSGGWQNPFRFEADELALFLAEADVVASATEALAMPFRRALALKVRVERRYQERQDAGRR